MLGMLRIAWRDGYPNSGTSGKVDYRGINLKWQIHNTDMETKTLFVTISLFSHQTGGVSGQSPALY